VIWAAGIRFAKSERTLGERGRAHFNGEERMMIGVRSVVVGCVVGVLALTGCAADSSEQSEKPGDNGAVANVADDVNAAADTVSLNCGQSIPGFPPLPCNPDLRFGQMLVEEVQPGGNTAPGNYLWYQVLNDSKKAAGAFNARITDGNGKTLQTYSFAGLGAGASTWIVFAAPYTCGWSRVAELDYGNTVAEAAEYNNTNTYSYACQRR
jgi:hypothetical protein